MDDQEAVNDTLQQFLRYRDSNVEVPVASNTATDPQQPTLRPAAPVSSRPTNDAVIDLTAELPSHPSSAFQPPPPSRQLPRSFGQVIQQQGSLPNGHFNNVGRQVLDFGGQQQQPLPPLPPFTQERWQTMPFQQQQQYYAQYHQLMQERQLRQQLQQQQANGISTIPRTSPYVIVSGTAPQLIPSSHPQQQQQQRIAGPPLRPPQVGAPVAPTTGYIVHNGVMPLINPAVGRVAALTNTVSRSINSTISQQHQQQQRIHAQPLQGVPFNQRGTVAYGMNTNYNNGAVVVGGSRSGLPVYQAPPSITAAQALKTVLEGLETAGSAHKDELPPKFLEKFQGRMTTTLLRHQRRALLWMIKRETGKTPIGGILADDQGLGKTVSAIALIVSQPRAEEDRIDVVDEVDDEENKDGDGDSDGDGDDKKKEEKNTSGDDNTNTNEDDVVIDDDDGDSKKKKKKKQKQVEEEKKEDDTDNPILIDVSEKEVKQQSTAAAEKIAKEEKYLKSKGLLAGTLVVCPSTVLYQWEDEIKSKTPRRITEFGDNRVYVYHGRSKGITPQTLARFQVVLTTYGTMTQELPEFKRPVEKQMYGPNDPIDLVDEDDGGDGKGKKRKRTFSGGPLYQVKWHRVVLDEAQVIKNYRTLAAHAAWALNADRRWCLSGTPMQNSVDDLYSYFKFLQYNPYNKYATFKELIKDPISRDDSSTGYRRLRVILQNILLRRTKTTKIDGDPIITLPERRVKLLQVEFGEEERAFYDQLQKEVDTKMKKIQSEGTAGQNYISMLYMLLRLRQACNHPSLVRGASSVGGNSNANHLSKAELAAEQKAAKKLLPAVRASLLATLRDTMSECVACRDVPEDPVISICGHMFCRQCVSAAISTAGQGKDEEELAFHCPQCSKALHKNGTFGLEALDSSSGGSGNASMSMPSTKTVKHEVDEDGAVVLDDSDDEDDKDKKAKAMLRNIQWHKHSSTKIKALMKILRDLRNGIVHNDDGGGGGDSSNDDVMDMQCHTTNGDGVLMQSDGNGGGGGVNTMNTNTTMTVVKREEIKKEKPVSRNLSMAKLHSAINRGSSSNSLQHTSSSPSLQQQTYNQQQQQPLMEKVIIFSQWTSMLNLIETALDKENFSYRRLDGTQSLNARQTAIKDFTRRPDVCIMLVSLKAASLGVNLVSANHVVLMDLWYNPSTEDQAIDRAHRIGQTKPVNVTRITVKDTVEDKILLMQEKKQKMVSSAFGENGAEAGMGMRLTVTDIMGLFGFGGPQ